MKGYTECMEVREDLSAYFDGELAQEERDAIDVHLRDCAECLRELDAFKRVDVAYGRLKQPGAPAGFEEGVRAAMNSGKSSGAGSRRSVPRWAGPLVAAAAAAVVVVVGVVLLERQRGERLQVASVEQEALASGAMSAAPEATAVRAEKPTGDWESFAGARREESRGRAVGGADAEGTKEWDNFVKSSSDAPQEPDKAVSIPEDLQRKTDGALEDAVGRADERSMEKELVAAAAPAPSAPESLDADRQAVLGEPPAGLAPESAEALREAAEAAERDSTEAKSLIEQQAQQLRDTGDVVTQLTLRSFTVGSDGVWYEKGYDGEPATPLARGSDELREVMKKYPEFNWNKLLDRSARQVFQLDDAWYDLEAAAELE